MTPKEYHDKLNDLIQYHCYLYYGLDMPIILDYEYDLMYHELARLESKHPELISDESRTQQVGWTPGRIYERKYPEWEYTKSLY